MVGTAAATAEGFAKLGEIAPDVISGIAESSSALAALVPAYAVIDGSVRTRVGVCGLLAGGTVAVVGGLYGAAAAPFDGGAALGGAMDVARGTSAWGASVAIQGCRRLIAVKAATPRILNQDAKFVPVVGAMRPGCREIDGSSKGETGVGVHVAAVGAVALMTGLGAAAAGGGATLGDAMYVLTCIL